VDSVAATSTKVPLQIPAHLLYISNNKWLECFSPFRVESGVRVGSTVRALCYFLSLMKWLWQKETNKIISDCITNNLQKRILSLNRKKNIIFKIKTIKYKNYYF
jgi:hypothetical protein